jgi:hypothetical protein
VEEFLNLADVATWRRLATDVEPFKISSSLAVMRVISSSEIGVAVMEESTTNVFLLNLPKELIAEAERQPQPKVELKVEGWKTSWLSRLSERVLGRD